MLPLILFIAALGAGEVPGDGRFLFIGENDEAMGVIDASRIEHDGDRHRARWTVAFALVEEGARVEQFVEEIDCATDRSRTVEAAYFAESMEMLRGGELASEWSSPPSSSPGGRMIAYVCDNESLPEAGRSYLQIAQAFWARVAARSTV